MADESKRRHIFISHHHKDDQIVADFLSLIGDHGYDIRNSSIRANPANLERLDKGLVSDEVIRRLLRMKISWAGTVVVLIGKDTHTRPWVDWEINKAKEQGKRIVGVFAQGGTDADIPKGVTDYASAIVNWNTKSIMDAIDGKNSFKNVDGSDRPPNAGPSITCN
jgi:MTH538 TIR-like domain (DUF1863)